MSEFRFALCHAVRSRHLPVAAAARDFGVSRKTAHNGLSVFDCAAAAGGRPLPASGAARRARGRDRRGPGRPPPPGPAATSNVRPSPSATGTTGGPARSARSSSGRPNAPPPAVPSARTFAASLRRNGRDGPRPAPAQSFERPAPYQLWQLDRKGPVEVARRPVTPLTVIDDHSHTTAWPPARSTTRPWPPPSPPCGTCSPTPARPTRCCATTRSTPPAPARPASRGSTRGSSAWASARPTAARTTPGPQGECERLHGSAVREFIAFNARRDDRGHFDEDAERWRAVYNTLRPHEASATARHIRGGRATVRAALYRAARHDPTIREHYRRLKANGKRKKWRWWRACESD